MIRSGGGVSAAPGRSIRIAAAAIFDCEGRVLLVRKRGTIFFMQPGGKLEDGETDLEALARELNEELGCGLVKAVYLGAFSAPAANEPTYVVEAALYAVEISGGISKGAEIEEIAWVVPHQTTTLPLAPLTQRYVLPLARAGRT